MSLSQGCLHLQYFQCLSKPGTSYQATVEVARKETIPRKGENKVYKEFRKGHIYITLLHKTKQAKGQATQHGKLEVEISGGETARFFFFCLLYFPHFLK